MSGCDLLVIGAGINGAGIARDAAGRGLSVLLVERGDIGGATSSASSKLLHGGLRYLERYAFGLVREALAERARLLSVCGHIARPLTFVLPHAPHLRPRVMLRGGLLLYDLLGGRSGLPRSRRVDLHAAPYAGSLRPEFRDGYAYSDAWVDDARLVLLNVRDAVDRGATLRLGWEVTEGRRRAGCWVLRLRDPRSGAIGTVEARAVVNAAGPWAAEVAARLHAPGDGRHAAPPRLKHVQGSHIVVPRLYQGAHACILQHPDRRVVFLIPYEHRYTLIGTTDVDVGERYADPRPDAAEIAYLCQVASGYAARPVTPDEVVWSFSGVRALVDDRREDPSAVTRDYRLEVEAGAEGTAPLLHVLGGKITTYRALAENALERLAPWLGRRPRWTSGAPLPGADLGPGGFDGLCARLAARHPWLAPESLAALARRHGTLTDALLDGARGSADLGPDFGGGLHERELRWFAEREWARCAEDVLWRRSKAGLHMSDEQRAALARWFADSGGGR